MKAADRVSEYSVPVGKCPACNLTVSALVRLAVKVGELTLVDGQPHVETTTSIRGCRITHDCDGADTRGGDE